MYGLRFDHGVTSAGFALSPRGLASLSPELAARGPASPGDAGPAALWRALLQRYPTIGALFADATPLRPLGFRGRMQHRLARAADGRWALLPHAYAFVDPLFSTGIAWGLRAIERLALCFESASRGTGAPSASELARYDELLAAEADQVDILVAGAYDAMAHFDLFAAHAMIYFASVSYTEARQRLLPEEGVAWQGFLGVGDPLVHPLPRQSARRLRRINGGRGDPGTAEGRAAYQSWVTRAIAPRNIAGLAEPRRHGLYPVDLDVLVERHALLGMSREEVLSALPRLR
jgi:FADH2 O2-dependent halogenase